MNRAYLSCSCLLMGLFLGCGDGGISAAGGAGGSGGTSISTGGEGGTGGEPFRIALSVSPFTGVLFESGAQYTDGTLTATDAESLEQLYVAHGANELFARISTERKKTSASDDHSLETALARAALAKKLGLAFNPELGLWKHYGDITCEPAPDFSEYPEIAVPGPWETLTVDQMIPPLRDYGALVAQEILATGVTVDYWDLGNEIDFGVAGVAPEGTKCSTPYVAPDGVDPEIGKMKVLDLLLYKTESQRIDWLTDHIWPREAKLLTAVADGIRSVDPEARFSTHMSQSLSFEYAVATYQGLQDSGFSVDRIGFSFYPAAAEVSLPAQKFKNTLYAVQEHFDKPAYIAEVAYLASPISTGPYQSWTHLIEKYPMSEDGQAAFLHDLTSWAAASGVSGIRPWAPEVYVAGWDGFALFVDGNGSPAPARKALAALADGAAAPDMVAFSDQ